MSFKTSLNRANKYDNISVVVYGVLSLIVLRLFFGSIDPSIKRNVCYSLVLILLICVLSLRSRPINGNWLLGTVTIVGVAGGVSSIILVPIRLLSSGKSISLSGEVILGCAASFFVYAGIGFVVGLLLRKYRFRW